MSEQGVVAKAVKAAKAERRGGGERAEARRKTVSYFQLLANRANAIRSCGPRTPDGKARASANALKHGFRAVHALMDENPEAIEREHAEWLSAFQPKDAAAKSACDLAFRLKRQLERILAADDAHVTIEQERVDIAARRDRDRFFERAKVGFEVDPYRGVSDLLAVQCGLDHLESMLVAFEADLLAGVWSPTHSAKLRAVEGLEDGRDPELDALVALVDGLARDRAQLNGEPSLVGPPRPMAPGVLEASIRDRQRKLQPLSDAVRGRVRAAKATLNQARPDVRAEELARLRRLMDVRKLNASPEAQLLHRYRSQAFREYAQALALAARLCRYKPAESAPLPGFLEKVTREVFESWAPNEPKSGGDGRTGSSDGKGAPTNVPRDGRG